jgi:hypothetical protein
MDWLSDVIKVLLAAPPWIIVLLVGLLLIVFGAVGKIGTYIDVGSLTHRRLVGGVGAGLVALGLVLPQFGPNYAESAGSDGNGVRIPANACQVVLDAEGIVTVCTSVETNAPPAGCWMVRDNQLRVIACRTQAVTAV